VQDTLHEPEPVDLGSVIGEAVDRVRVTAESHGVVIEAATEPGLTVFGDRELLTTAVANLVSNAVNYSDSDTKVAVASRRAGEFAEITVTDQGHGIPAGEQQRIFERFYRVDAARSRATGGTGLGLAIVKHICTNHGGEVTVWSDEGHGSTFTMRLPRAIQKTVPAPYAFPRHLSPHEPRSPERMTRILVVEDEVSFSDPLSYLLRKEGYDVAVAETGPDALTEFDANGADLVLLDLMLPGLPGVDVCRALRARSNVPVIMLTAKDSEIDKVVGLELGADDYVTKPYSSRELLARIKAVLRRLSEPEELLPTTVEAGPVRMDVERHVVSVGGNQISLPLKEFELLEMLLRNTGRVLTRIQLIDRVWGSDYVGDTKTLDVHVKRLRAKIEPDPGNPKHIVTVRGLGYKFEQ
jgi:two-component system response regulator RegX3